MFVNYFSFFQISSFLQEIVEEDAKKSSQDWLLPFLLLFFMRMLLWGGEGPKELPRLFLPAFCGLSQPTLSPSHCICVCVCVCVCVHVHICLFIKGKNGKVFYYYPAFLGFFLWFHLLRVEKWRNFIIKAIGAILRERVKKDEHHQECQSQRSRGNSEDHLRDQRLGSSLMGAEAKGIHCTSNVIQSPCLMLSTSTSSYLNVTFSSIKIQSLYSASKTYPTYFHPECFLWQICSFWTRNRSFLHFTSQP